MNDLNRKATVALKWSSFAEIASKIITPVVNLILARLLTPEAFGVVATVTMVVSFADMFSDSGFQKFLVQCDFKDEISLYNSATVAFTVNLIVSLFLWFIISCFNAPIANIVGNPGLGIVIIVAGISLPITSFSSIQSAIYRRNFDFKTLCIARISVAFVPIFVTIPMAWFGMSYWAMIIGSLGGNICNAIILTLKSPWKPRLHFNFSEFKVMFSFSFWSLIESIGTWLTSYIGTFIVGAILSQYYVGLYKTTMTTVNGIFAIITSATTGVLFSLLSRLQHNREEYEKTYCTFIGAVSLIIIPLGFGIFIFKELVTKLLLGNQWLEAIDFVGIYGLFSCFSLVYGQYAAEFYRGLGKPKASVLTTILHLITLIPVLIFTAKSGFVSLAYGRSIIKIQQILSFWVVLLICFKFNPLKLINKTWKAIVSSTVMAMIGYLLLFVNSSVSFQIFSVVICCVVYFAFYAYVLRGKKDISYILNIVKKR